MTAERMDDLTPVCPHCGAVNSVLEEATITVAIPADNFDRLPSGKVVVSEWGYYDASEYPPDSTGMYHCAMCNEEFKGCQMFFKEVS